MALQFIKKHKNIGVDIDDTLIGHNPNKKILQDFIIENYQDYNFHLITFRTGTWLEDAYIHINQDNNDLMPEMFKTLTGVPQAFADGYNKYNFYKRNSFHKYDDEMRANLDEHRVTAGQYVHWKGAQARILNCPVLLDDMTDLVKPGCDKYTVIHIHPDEITL